MAVADAFDAMTSSRPYRAAMPAERAIEILRSESGMQFDPAVVATFLRVPAAMWEKLRARGESLTLSGLRALRAGE